MSETRQIEAVPGQAKPGFRSRMQWPRRATFELRAMQKREAVRAWKASAHAKMGRINWTQLTQLPFIRPMARMAGCGTTRAAFHK